MLRAIVSSLILAGIARAGLSDMRATIPGSMHQCDNSSVFFFQTDDIGSKTLLFVSPADASKLGSGTVTLSSALAATTPLQQVTGINTPDAAAFSFFLKVEENVAFSTFGFLSNGQGKNMNLDRTVMEPLPGAANCLAGASAAPAPVVTPSTSALPASSATSSPQYVSRFVTSTRPAASTTAVSSDASSSSISTTSLPTTGPAPSSTVVSLPPSSVANATTPAAAATSPVVVKATYLLTSFITISDDQTTDGTVSSSVIKGGHVTGSVNGTLLPIGNVLFSPNTTAVVQPTTANSTIKAAVNATSDAQPILLSASYTFVTDAGESVFVMAQTPLSQNYTTQALLMTLQSSNVNSTLFSNMTILGKPESINSTMFRIDAYYLKA